MWPARVFLGSAGSPRLKECTLIFMLEEKEERWQEEEEEGEEKEEEEEV